jgi:anti-sigma-K factor RskA
MSAEQHEEQACLYALNLLSPDDAAGFEAEMRRSPELQRLTRELRASSCSLAYAAPPLSPPPELKTRLLETVGVRPAPAPSTPVLIFTARFLPWAAAAVFAVSALWLAQLHFAQRSATDLLASQASLTEVALQSARQQVEAERLLARQQIAALEAQVAERDRRVAQLTSDLKSQADLAELRITALSSLLKNSPQALAVAVWSNTRQEGVLQVEKLPPLAPGQDYQLWVVDPQYANPVDGGVFAVDTQSGGARVVFRARQPVAKVNAFAVTLERKGGVPKAEGPFVLLGK